MNAIEATSISKRYRRVVGSRTLRGLLDHPVRHEFWAIRDVSINVGRGETIAVIGANGSGKSTLLRVLAGVTKPTNGKLAIHDRVNGLLTLGEGFHPELSGTEAAITGAILAGYGRREARRLVSIIARFAELEDQMHQPLRTYSDGQRLRLAFSVAIHIEPEILLIDEILAVGDLGFQDKCIQRITGMKEAGTTIIMATHNLADVVRLCNRALWLHDGKVRGLGEAEQITSEYRAGSPASSQPVPLSGRRTGSGEIRITSIRLMDGHGSETADAMSGSALAVEFAYTNSSDISEAIFGVGIHTKPGGKQCVDVNTLSDGHPVGNLGPGGTVRLEFDRMDLGAGTYAVEVGAYTRDWKPLDYIWEAMTFNVSGSGDPGMVTPPRQWSLK